jgi:non-specific serine/threonine protein kinase
MSLPDPESASDLDALSKIESVRLFTARAVGGNPKFKITETNAPSVIQICRRLDGIPLALELAAARIKVLPADEIARRLDDRFRLLGSMRTGLPHHQTLRALIDWSYDQLTNREKLLCGRLSLFAGGWSLEAAEAVCGGSGIDDWEVLDLLTRLIEKSLVEVDIEGAGASGKPRYRMLETIREYARERLLEMKEGSETLVKLRGYFVTLAEESEPCLTGPEQGKFLARLAAEDDNLRLALDLCADPRAEPEIAWRLSGALGRYWYLRGKWFEGRKAYAEVLSRPEPREGAAAAGALNWAGNLAKEQGDTAQARAYLEEALAIRRRLGEPGGLANALNNLGNVLKDQDALGDARVFYEESLGIQRRLGNQSGIALALASLGALAFKQGECASAMAFCEESLGLYRRLGNRAAIATTLNNLGAFAESCGELKRAMGYLDESLSICRETGDSRIVAASLNNLGQIAEDAGDLPRARSYYEEGLATVRKLGNRKGIAIFLNNLGEVLTREGNYPRARQVLQESLAIFRTLNDLTTLPSLLHSLAMLAAEEGDDPRAARILAAADAHRKSADPHPANGETHADAVRVRLKSFCGSEWDAGAVLTLDEAVRFALDDSNI